MTVPDSASLHVSSVTLDAWVKFSSLDASLHGIIGKEVGTADTDFLRNVWYQNGTFNAAVGDATGFGLDRDRQPDPPRSAHGTD